MKSTRRSFLTSAVSLILCFMMLIGTTFAWFTDEVTSSSNVIQAGSLKIGLKWSKDNATWHTAGGLNDKPIFDYDRWEPGYTEVRYLKVENKGNLAFKYQMSINPVSPVGKLAEVIDVSFDIVTGNTGFVAPTKDNKQGSLTKVSTLDKLIEANGIVAGGVLLPDGTEKEGYYDGEIVICVTFHMQENAGNKYQNLSIGDGFGIKLVATQFDYESDSFDNSYDDDALWPESEDGYSASTSVAESNISYGTLKNDLTIGDANGVGATIPADVKIADGTTSLELTMNKVEDNFVLGDNVTSFDVHISGIASDNQKPMIVNLGPVLPKNLSDTELKLYHTENGQNNLMTRVASAYDFAIHNQYTYDEATGNVSIYVKSFSVFSAVETTASKWEDSTEADTSWYNDEDTEFTLEDVADFLGFRDLVDAGNTFEGKTLKLAVDIDLANKPFDPIGFGYWYEKNVVDGKDNNTVFMGTFDGGNHTIYNLYENCWELDPDKTNYGTYTYSTTGAGLFASIKNATIKNLAVSGAEIVFECVDMGVVVGYAQGTCHFENIIVTNSKIANYNRYTGGVVGEVSYGPYGIDKSLGYSHTFKNVTVDSSVTVSGLWGSFGCGMGGVIGGKWGDATVYMENVVSAPTMDVYNDVVSAYQWYAFRGCGMLIGHTEEPYSDGRHSGNATASFLTCVNVNVYYGDWVNYNYYEFKNQDSSTGRSYPWVRAEAGEYCDAFSNIRYGVPTHNGVKVSDLTDEELKAVATDYTTIVFNQLYGADRGMYGTNEHEGVNVSYSSPKTFYIENNLGWENLKLHYIYSDGEETWTTVPDGVELTEFNGVYRIDLPKDTYSFTITADGGKESKEFVVSELTEKETYPVHEHVFVEDKCECGATKIDTWEKLTNETELKIGDFIVFVYEKDKMELSSFSTTNTIYGIGTEFDTLPNGQMIFEVVEGSDEGTISFKNGNDYLCWNSGNSLNMSATLDIDTSWTVTADENGNATVLNAKDNTRKLQWNATSPRFACYTSSQAAISIYVKVFDVVCGECPMRVIDHKDASCVAAGYTTKQCSVCGKVETTTTEALTHNYTGENPYICLNNCGIHDLPEDGSTITIQEALWIAETLENGKETSNKYVITGVINDKDHPSETGATTITIGDHSIYITNIHNKDGTVGYKDFITKPKNGDEITVSAKIAKNASGEQQLRETWLADHIDTDEDGACDYCGIVFNASEVTESLKVVGTNGTLAGDKSFITWEQNGVIVSNNKAASTTAIRNSDSDHYRIYKSSKITVSVDNATIIKVVITCTSSYINGIKTGAENAGYEVSVDGLVVTITTNEAVSSIEFTVSEQARMTNVEVTYTTDNSGNEGGETPTPVCTYEKCTVDECKGCLNSNCEICETICKGHQTEPTVVLEITKDDFNSTSYAANNNTKTENGYSYISYQVMNQSNTMQWQKSKGYITIASNDFVKLELKVSAGTYTVTVGGKTVTGTTANGVTTYDLTGLTGEVKISVGSATGNVDYIKFYK